MKRQIGLTKMMFAIVALSGVFACGDGLRTISTTEAWKMPVTEMPLGPAGLTQTISSKSLASGVEYYHVARGASGTADFWTVNIGFYSTRGGAQSDAATLSAAGFPTRLDPSAGMDLNGATLGYYLSVGNYGSNAEATAAATRVAQATSNRYKPAIRNTALAGGSATGPWLVNVLVIKPSSTTADLAMTLPRGNDLGGNGETVSAAAARLNALAGMNGGFFSNINPFDAPFPPRSPVGTTVLDGKLIATAVGGRPGLMIAKAIDGHPKVTVLPELTTRVTVSDAQGVATEIKGINRPILGTVVNCGTPAEAPTTFPRQDSVCTNYNDLLMYDSLYGQGKASNTLVDAGYKGATYELLIDASGTVVSGHAPLGSPPPAGGHVLQGLGRNAAWLQNHSMSGTRLAMASHVYAAGAEITLTPDVSILEGGPTLSVANLSANAAREGFTPIAGANDQGEAAAIPNQNWYEGWYVDRNGRTAAGVAGDGTILLVEIDGRQPGLSLGTTISETKAVMDWLGAVSSINLDGGGSSNMVVGGTIVGHPSDLAGERAVGDALMIVGKNL